MMHIWFTHDLRSAFAVHARTGLCVASSYRATTAVTPVITWGITERTQGAVFPDDLRAVFPTALAPGKILP
jgi:hypothetical protein